MVTSNMRAWEVVTCCRPRLRNSLIEYERVCSWFGLAIRFRIVSWGHMDGNANLGKLLLNAMYQTIQLVRSIVYVLITNGNQLRVFCMTNVLSMVVIDVRQLRV